MKKILLCIVTLILAFLIFGCNFNTQDPFLALDEKAEEELLNFEIEKIALSKGFQSTESNVEILKDSKNLKILANIGLVESSGIAIDKIAKLGKTINIYVDAISKQGKIQLAVPQIILTINDPIEENPHELKFNIINQNYNIVPLKYNKDQVLDRIYSHFKIEPNSMPDVKLARLRDQIIWKISFTNIYNKDNIKSPLINLKVQVNALTGEIMDSVKDDISVCIDDGILLDYMPNSTILYKRNYIENNIKYETLWTYNIETNQKDKLYTSKNKIYSAIFSPDGQCISLIEVNENQSDLYIIPMQEKIAFKVSSNIFLHPKLMKWKDDNVLCFINIKDGYSTLLSYSIHDNKSKIMLQIDSVIESFDISNDKILYIISDTDVVNKEIYLIEDGVESQSIGKGFKASFLDDINILYLKNQEEENKNIFYVYNIEQNDNVVNLTQDIINYMKLDDKNITLIEKNTNNNDYTLNIYSIEEKLLTPIAKINSSSVFYNSNNNRGYINLHPPYKEDNLDIIYSVDLKKLAIIDANK